MTIEGAQYMLMVHEQRIEHLNSTSQVDISSASAHFVDGNQTNVNRQSQPQRGGFGNGINGNGRGRGRGRNGGRWNNNKPTCQICGRVGHLASYCYNKFDRNYQAPVNQNNNEAGGSGAQNNFQQNSFQQHPMRQFPAPTNQQNQANVMQSTTYYATPESVCDQSWYADSGAINHVTSYLSNLFL
ncbi:hypothetical protein ACOSQ3_014085 [Xanthoceras sorbifolium]